MDTIDVNNFTVDILTKLGRAEKVTKKGSYYFPLEHGTEYRLRLGNNGSARCDAYVWIDGEKVGVWRIQANDSITIERPANVSRKFTFLKEGTTDAIGAKINSGRFENGLIKVVFKPEKRLFDFSQVACKGCKTGAYEFSYTNNMIDSNLQSASLGMKYSSGATALGNKSYQDFTYTSEITDIDIGNVTTIYARLIVDHYNKPSKWYSPYISLGEGLRHTNTPPRIDGYHPWFD